MLFKDSSKTKHKQDLFFDSQPFEIAESRRKIFFLLICGLGFVAAGIWMMLRYKESIGLAIFGLITTGFFGAAFPLGVKKLESPEVKYKLTKKSLQINYAKHLKLFVDWKDISSFQKARVEDKKSILIKVKEPEELIEQESNQFKKKLMQSYYSEIGSPFFVSAKDMNISHNAFLMKLKEYHTKYGV